MQPQPARLLDSPHSQRSVNGPQIFHATSEHRSSPNQQPKPETRNQNMPHTTRKKKPTQPKRLTVEDADGWTHVTKGIAKAKQYQLPPSEDVLVPAEIPDGLTLEKAKVKYQQSKDVWDQSVACMRLEQTLKRRLAAHDDLLITNCVCLGLGTLTGLTKTNWADRRLASQYQLAALQTVLKVLCELFIQDLSVTRAELILFKSK